MFWHLICKSRGNNNQTSLRMLQQGGIAAVIQKTHITRAGHLQRRYAGITILRKTPLPGRPQLGTGCFCQYRCIKWSDTRKKTRISRAGRRPAIHHAYFFPAGAAGAAGAGPDAAICGSPSAVVGILPDFASSSGSTLASGMNTLGRTLFRFAATSFVMS